MCSSDLYMAYMALEVRSCGIPFAYHEWANCQHQSNLSLKTGIHAPQARRKVLQNKFQRNFPRDMSSVLLPKNVRASMSEQASYPAATNDKPAQQLIKDAYIHMARPVNLAPSMLLVIFGAWASTGQLLHVLGSSTVWLVCFIASGVSVASVVVNDYFDYRSGADVINSPQKPLPSGLIEPDRALLFSSALYIAVLIATCFMAQSALRSVIAVSAAATLLYTPLLKQVTGLKNATVAAVIAASPLAGALAAGAGQLGVTKLLPLCAFVFLGIMYREILMDISDVDGDRSAGIHTIPVVAGQKVALGIAVSAIMAAGGLLLHAALHGQGLAWLALHAGISLQVVRGASFVGGLIAMQSVAMDAVGVWLSNFDSGIVSAAIDSSMRSIGFGAVILALIT